MKGDPDLGGEFGAGFDWESGAYPTPPEPVREQFEEESNDIEPTLQFPTETHTKDSEDEGLTIDNFRGVVLSVIPPHTLFVADSEDDLRVGSLFLGNGREWVRVNFWGEIADRVTDFADVGSNTTVEINGAITDEDNEVTDFFVFDDKRTGVTRVEESVTYNPKPIDTNSIKTESLVETVVGEVVTSVSDVHQNDDGETFKVQHLTLDIDGEKFVVELHDSHADEDLRIGDRLCVFAGWGKNKEQFIHKDLLQIDYEGKFWVRNYSGLRNLTRNPLPE